MKLQTYQAFKQHLKQHFNGAKENLFAVVAMDFYERELIVKGILESFKESRVVFFEALDANFSALRSELDSGDLFSEQKVFVIKSFEKASKSFSDQLALYLENGSEYSIILEGEKLDKGFYDKVTKKIIALDLTNEKPWDRKGRIVSWLNHYAKKENKQLSLDLAEHLYDSSNKELSIMLQELNKLICYTVGSSNITMADFKAVSSTSKEDKLWNLSEELVFQADRKFFEEVACKKLDSTTFHLLIAQMRYHLQIAAKLQSLQKDVKKPLASHFPNIQPKTLQKYENALASKPSAYAENALKALFEAEVKSKSIPVDENVLFLELITKLSQCAEKKRYV